VNELLGGFVLGPLVVVGLVHLVQGGSASTFFGSVSKRTLGIAQLVVGSLYVVRASSFGIVSAVVFAIFGLHLAERWVSSRGSDCGCSVLFASAADGWTLVRALVYSVASIAYSLNVSGEQVSPLLLLAGGCLGIVVFITFEALSYVFGVVRQGPVRATAVRRT